MSESPSEPRVKRQKVDKLGRFAALEKLKSLKGQKNKCEVGEEVNNVYDIVDEKDYAKKISEQYALDWIEDDGSGVNYVEDGRDLFEDEDEYSDEGTSTSGKNKKAKKRQREANEKSIKGQKSIMSAFSNVVQKKKKEPQVKLDEDDVLADILGEMDENKTKPLPNSKKESSSSSNISKFSAAQNEKAIVKEYMEKFASNFKKKEASRKALSVGSDDEIIENALKPTKVEPITKTNEDFKDNNKTNHSSPMKEIQKSTNHEEPTKQDEDENQGFIAEAIDYMDQDCFNDKEKEFEEKEPRLESQSEHTETVKTLPDDIDAVLSNWENICKMDDFDEDINELDESMPSEGNLKMWYWDAWEDVNKRPGELFLFGKVKGEKGNYTSVCVHVENAEKVLYLLPREYALDPITKEPTRNKVTDNDVYKEFNETTTELGISSFRSKKISRNFAFQVAGLDIPNKCECYQIRYDGKFSTPTNKKSFNNIAYIFGTKTPALETFLLERKIKGPCWLNLNNYKVNERPLSWCKLEVACSKSNSITVAEECNTNPPPMVILTMNVRTALNPKTMKNEVAMISCLVNNKFRVDKPAPNPPFNRHFCGFTRPSVQSWPIDLGQKMQHYKSTKITKLDTERALLSWFLATYQNIDPDLIVTHDAKDCQLDVICDRIGVLKVPMWSKISRLRMSQNFGKKMKDFFIGRMICDVKQSAEELIKCRSYDLDSLCVNVLKLKEGERVDVSNDDLYMMYESGEGLLKLITLTMQDCSYVLKLMCELNVLPLALQITNICGNLMSRTLQGGRSERNEFLLLHAFTEKEYIVPDKKVREVNWDNPEVSTQMNQPSSRKKAAYSGGLVLDPIKGFYDKYILLMDFNSLYPSIIQEYNICFTTISAPAIEDEIPSIPDSKMAQGVLPQQIRRLVESRREVKKLMANPDLSAEQKMQYNIRQLALKLTANSMYGCLGFAHSRFFAQHLAALVTYKGREILMNTKSLVQKLNFNVIYGDTDSIMINTNSTDFDQVLKIGQSIKQTVNKIYRQIELDIDGVFKCLLLLKKKKYAAVILSKNSRGEIVETSEYKGLDIVRRDWSQISVMAGKQVLNEILSDKQLDERIENIHAGLEKMKDNLLEGTVPRALLTITKQLTKAPRDYTSINTLPHVQVALRMNATRNKRYKKGDMVSYIICEDGTDKPAMQRAYHLEELNTNENLKVDNMYYLAQQIHPVVSRLCEPLEGTDASRIAACLGLDPSKFKVAAQKVQRERMEEEIGASLAKNSLQKFRNCEKFKFTCVSCKTINTVASAFKPMNNSRVGVLQQCSNKDCNSSPTDYVISIRNELILSVRSCIRRFYENWMVCDDPACNNNSRTYIHVTTTNRPICLVCKQGVLIRQYSERDLFNQLSYYQYVFDLSQHQQKNANLSAEVNFAYNLLKETVDKYLENSEYCTVNLSKIFGTLRAVSYSESNRGSSLLVN